MGIFFLFGGLTLLAECISYRLSHNVIDSNNTSSKMCLFRHNVLAVHLFFYFFICRHPLLYLKSTTTIHHLRKGNKNMKMN
ncbi:hypothetical protein GDO81_010531 [Engystomops pustulosus]|uniref:Secreted protein n=1 Tax=Engystomops pustulosus TaxID=76066 RepID=A0AAV7C1R3_ENGPU|nr:hypothetical protein GDO81_010531 [Engystomops pustulosus]